MPIVEIEILGRRYALQSDRDPAHVQAVASHVDEQLRQMARAGVSSVTRDDAVLVALALSDLLGASGLASDGAASEGTGDRYSPWRGLAGWRGSR